jgi:hypothetical protein
MTRVDNVESAFSGKGVMLSDAMRCDAIRRNEMRAR